MAEILDSPKKLMTHCRRTLGQLIYLAVSKETSPEIRAEKWQLLLDLFLVLRLEEDKINLKTIGKKWMPCFTAQ